MKLLVVLVLGCFVHQTTGLACSRTFIFTDVLPTSYVADPNQCPASCVYTILAYFPNAFFPMITYGIRDNVILMPTSLSKPKNTAGMLIDPWLRILADKTNVYVVTHNLESTPALNAANNKLIMSMGQAIPTLRVLDYYSYLTTAPIPAPALLNPCSYFSTSPSTVAGACARSSCSRVIILTDELPPNPNYCDCCPGSCSFYTTAKYWSVTTLGLTPSDTLIIQANTTTGAPITGMGYSTADSFFTSLITTTNVVFLTSPGVNNTWSNSYINNMIFTFPAYYNVFQVKNYANYICPVALPPGVSCACKYFAAGMP